MRGVEGMRFSKSRCGQGLDSCHTRVVISREHSCGPWCWTEIGGIVSRVGSRRLGSVGSSRWLWAAALAGIATAILGLGLGAEGAQAACFAEGPFDTTAPTLTSGFTPNGVGPWGHALPLTE